MRHTASISNALPQPVPQEASPYTASGARRRNTAPPGRASRLVRGAIWLACLDSLGAVAALGLVLILVNLPTVTLGLDSFLSARITVKNLLLVTFLTTMWPVVFRLCGLYHVEQTHRLGSELVRLLAAVSIGTALALSVPLTSMTGSIRVADLQLFWLASFGFCLLGRAVRRAAVRAHNPLLPRALIVGTGRLARRAHRDIQTAVMGRYEVVGFVDEPSDGGPDSEWLR